MRDPQAQSQWKISNNIFTNGDDKRSDALTIYNVESFRFSWKEPHLSKSKRGKKSEQKLNWLEADKCLLHIDKHIKHRWDYQSKRKVLKLFWPFCSIYSLDCYVFWAKTTWNEKKKWFLSFFVDSIREVCKISKKKFFILWPCCLQRDKFSP